MWLADVFRGDLRVIDVRAVVVVCLVAMSLVSSVGRAAAESGDAQPGGSEPQQTDSSPAQESLMLEVGYLHEDLRRIAEMEGLSLETVKEYWDIKEQLRPYISQIKAARTKDFAGFWWANDVPLTANFATSGDVAEFTQFVQKTIAHLDEKALSTVRVHEAGKSYEYLKNLRRENTDELRDQGYRFDSEVDTVNGKVTFTVEADTAGEFSAALASIPGLDAGDVAAVVRIVPGELAEPAAPGFGDGKLGTTSGCLASFIVRSTSDSSIFGVLSAGHGMCPSLALRS